MSKADEMFDEIGYEKVHDNKRRITYKLLFSKIEFNIGKRWIYTDANLGIKELQAINEKVKELQWI